MSKKVKYKYSDNIQSSVVSESMVMYKVAENKISGSNVFQLKELCKFSDDEMAKWYSVNIKTFRTYKQPNHQLKPNVQEHTIKLTALFKKGIEVFGDIQQFKLWLTLPHHLFDGKSPSINLTTISGINFLYSTLVGLEYGDNA